MGAMDKAKFKEMMLNILRVVDYDVADQYDEETAEIPEEVEEYWEDVFNAASKYINLS